MWDALSSQGRLQTKGLTFVSEQEESYQVPAVEEQEAFQLTGGLHWSRPAEGQHHRQHQLPGARRLLVQVSIIFNYIYRTIRSVDFLIEIYTDIIKLQVIC